MNKEDSRKLRTGDVIAVQHGYNNVEHCTVMGSAITSRERGARIPIKRHRDGAEYTVYSARVVDVILIKGMEPQKERQDILPMTQEASE